MAILPSYRFARFRFFTPIGVKNVRLEAGRILGQWVLERYHHYGSPRETRISQLFANCDGSDKSILEFTRRYGPLTRGGNDGQGGFSFSTESWRDNQKEFAVLWMGLRAKDRRRAWPAGYTPLEGNMLWFTKGRWIDYECNDLWTFMSLELFAQPGLLRICERPDCERFFFANHGKERYCSTKCSNWSQSQLKKKWHEKQRQKRLLSRNAKRS
jgi:hypothetical protein